MRGRRKRSSVALAGLLALAQTTLAAEARAQGADSVVVEWSAPAGCPSADDVRADVRRALDASTQTRRAIAARIVVRGEGGSWRAEVQLAAAGEMAARTVEGDSCRGVADAVVLIVAFAAAPEAAAVPAPAPLKTTVPASPPVVPPPDRARPRRTLLGLSASFLVDAASLPVVSYGAEASLVWHPSRLRIEAVGQLLATVRGSTTARPDEGADFWLAHAGVRACYDLLGRSIDVGPCAGAGVDWTTAHGYGAQTTRSVTAAVATASLGARGRARVSKHLSLLLGVEGYVPAARPSFVVENAGLVYQPPIATIRGTLGAEVLF